MKVKGVIFDLDGTLVNSIEDLSDSLNYVLKKAGFPTHSYKTYETFIGAGIRNLVSQALPKDSDNATIDMFFKDMFDHYKTNCTHKTYIYDGIDELIIDLKRLNLPLAVLSNKADILTKKVVTEKFPGVFSSVTGLLTEVLKKPNPEIALSMCKELGIQPNETIFIGDTAADIKTAKNAGMISGAVSWGYRSKKDLLELNPDILFDTPMDILNYIK